jgi:hypothetical protein
MVFAIVPDQHETNCVSPVNTKCQPDIQSLASSALLPNQSLVAPAGQIRAAWCGTAECRRSHIPPTLNAYYMSAIGNILVNQNITSNLARFLQSMTLDVVVGTATGKAHTIQFCQDLQAEHVDMRVN